MKHSKTRAEPPYFGRAATYAFYAAQIGRDWVAPRNVKDYVTYKYWCITHQYDAIAAGVQPEEDAFDAYMTYHEEQQALWKYFLENVLDSDPES